MGDVGLFAGLTQEDVAEIETHCSWRIIAEGEQIFDQTSSSTEVYFIVEGGVRVLTYTNTGREVALANVMAGDYFGELAAIDNRGRSARVVAVTHTVIASIEGRQFMKVMEHHPTVAIRVLTRFAHIIRTLDSRVAELSQLSENQRVLAELVRLAEPDQRNPSAWTIPLMPSHKEIASWAGTSREIVAQTIGELARDGIVERRTMGLRIRDWSRLQLMARAGDVTH
ncbi:MAG: protein kinase [Alphaproteobacteria bacterium RIFOXYD12_FULL_60_8]|nr:MAG: protein kinase [Alphaproteobacteria bacterium RIFOXYD12_FULL_60_8]